jgi:siroheme synthase-like protein
MRYYPIFLDVQGRRCAVVGGGRVAERKVKALLRAGASVHVISPAVTPRLGLLAARKKIDLTRRAYRPGDLQGPATARVKRPQGVLLVFAATNSPETQRAVCKDAEKIGALVNAADDLRASDFIVPASFAQGDLQVAISTSGASPALARRLRQQLQLTLGREYRAYLQFLREARKQVIATVPDEAQRTKIFRQLSGALMMDWTNGMARNYKKLQVKMDPASIRDNKRRVREELRRLALKELRGAKQLTQDVVRPMNFGSIDDIRQSGFKDFRAISTLQESGCCDVPDVPGVYLVLRPNTAPPDFLERSTGGHFKGKDPTVAVSRLKSKWVEDALVLYIGEAGGPSNKATLRSRLKLYMQFGQGKPVGHRGGRYIWQLRDSCDLLVCWKPTPNAVPREVEKGLIREFKAVYKKLPFANIKN